MIFSVHTTRNNNLLYYVFLKIKIKIMETFEWKIHFWGFPATYLRMYSIFLF